MSRPLDPSALTSRTFRVQFRAEADIRQGVCIGRVEHVRSGDATHFSTVQELMAFVEFWLMSDPTLPGRDADSSIR